MTEELQRAIALIRSGDKNAARGLLVRVLKAAPQHEQAWLWMSAAVEGDDERRYCLERVLQINPDNPGARMGLAELDKPAEEERVDAAVQALSSEGEVEPELEPSADSIPESSDPDDRVSVALEPPPSASATGMQAAEAPTPSKAPSEPAAPPPSTAPPPDTAASEIQVWADSDARLDRVKVLEEERLVVANPDREVLRQARQELERGQIPAEALGGEVTSISLGQILMVSVDQRSARMTVRYRDEERPRIESIFFADSSVRDEVFAALKARLAPKFEQIERQFNAFQAMIFPALVALILGFFTYIFYAGAVELASGASITIRRPTLTKLLLTWVVSLIGPVGVLIVGAVLIVLTVIWAIKRASNPPMTMILRPRPGERGRDAGGGGGTSRLSLM